MARDGRRACICVFRISKFSHRRWSLARLPSDRRSPSSRNDRPRTVGQEADEESRLLRFTDSGRPRQAEIEVFFETVASLVGSFEAAVVFGRSFPLTQSVGRIGHGRARVNTLRIGQRVLCGWRICPRPGWSGGAGITGGGVVPIEGRRLVATAALSASCTTWGMRAAAGPWTFT